MKSAESDPVGFDTLRQGVDCRRIRTSTPPEGTALEPLVSAIIVNFNGGDLLATALDSLLAQTWPNLEVILVDNASTDGSAEAAAERFGERLRIVRNETNEGFAGGNNRGFEAARGDWFFLLNSDAAADPDAIERLMEFVAERDDVGMLACRVVVFDEPSVFDSVGLLLYPDGVCRPRGWEEKDLGQYDRPEEVIAPHGCAALLRRAMIDDVGAFDEAYFCYLEDLDLGMRGQLRGWKCWYVPTARVRHRKSSTAGNYSKFKAYHVERNRIWNVIKLMPRFIVFVSPFFTINRYLLQAYAARTQRGASGEFLKEYSWFQLLILMLRAYTAALARLPAMLRERRRITTMRKLSTDDWYRLISRFKLDAIELALKA